MVTPVRDNAQAKDFIAPPGWIYSGYATGPCEGQKVFSLQTLQAEPDKPRREVAASSGYSLHAGIAARAWQRDKLEHLARYVARPPVATEPLSLPGRVQEDVDSRPSKS